MAGRNLKASTEREAANTAKPGVTGKDNYIRDTLTVGDVSITFYRHESLTPEQVLDRIETHYKAWAVNRPGGRR
ncbi:MAG TPA: hypothetical protein VG324_08565 [Blastocatellia bacterium]|nr:hypothetical protein [Blastocatellia bacterium]